MTKEAFPTYFTLVSAYSLLCTLTMCSFGPLLETYVRWQWRKANCLSRCIVSTLVNGEESKTLDDCELGSVGTEHPWRSGDWRTVQHVSVASQNRRLITSSTADHYIDHYPKLASSQLTWAWLQQTELTIRDDDIRKRSLKEEVKRLRK